MRVLWQRPEATWVTTWTDGSDELEGTTHGAAWLAGRDRIKRRIGLALGTSFLVVTEGNGRLRQVDPVVTFFGTIPKRRGD